jgi:hypothetical protein
VGRRSRQRAREAAPGAEEPSRAPTSAYQDPEGNELVLRGALTAATRRRYAEALAGSPLSREDAWHRAVEYLFERLAVRWTIAGAPLSSQRELLLRFRAAGGSEREWIRRTLREHCAEHFPELRAP